MAFLALVVADDVVVVVVVVVVATIEWGLAHEDDEDEGDEVELVLF